MRKSGLWALAMLAGVMSAGAGAGQARAAAYPPNALVLFVASWCAPCHEELGRVGLIARAAGSRRVLIVPVDEGPNAALMLRRVPRNMVWHVGEGALAQQMHRDFFAGDVLLPRSFMTDGAGRVCAQAVAELSPGRVAGMAKRCG